MAVQYPYDGTLHVIGRFVLDSNNKRIADLNHAKLAVLSGLTSLNLVELATAHKSDGREFPARSMASRRDC